MPGSSGSNGDQRRSLWTDIKSRARGLRNEIDRQLGRIALADRDAPSGPTYAGNPPVVPIGSIDPSGYAGGGGGRYAPERPVKQPAPGDMPALMQDEQRSAIMGVSGTPITSAFLLDLAEYNPQLVGRAAVPVYEKMRRSNSIIAATLHTWKLPVLSAKFDVRPGVEKHEPGYGKAKEIAEFVRECLLNLEYQASDGSWHTQHWPSVVRNALKMLDFGASVYEEIWRVDGAKLRLRNLPDRQALTYYRWHTDTDGETLLALEQYGYRGARFENVTLPAEKMCRFTYNQEGANFFGIPLTRFFYTDYFFQDRVKRMQIIAVEKNSLGVPTWKLTKGFSKEDRDAAIDFVTKLANHEMLGIVEPPGDAHDGFRFTSPGTAAADMVKGLTELVSYYDTSMARSALAMFLTSGSTPFGNRATAKQHSDFFLLAEQALADQIGTTVSDSTVRRLVRYNFGEDAADNLLPKIVFANVQGRQLGEMVDAFSRLAQFGLVVSDQNIREWIREEFAVPEESREGLVAIRGETIDVGKPGSGVEISGKGGQPVAGPEKKIAPGLAVETSDRPLYAALPEAYEPLDKLEVGDQFILSRPVRFSETPPAGRYLTVLAPRSSNEWLKGRFQVRIKHPVCLTVDHLK